MDEKISKEKFNSKGKVLPKIDTIEISLLNQSVYLSKLKEYGYGIYVFFLYLLNLIFTFGILLIFAFYYIYYIFYKYYDELEDKEEYLLFEDYNLLSIVSGVQIIKFRKYYINKFGKEDFLEKYKNFDVIYKEYIYSGTIVFIATFLINFFFIIFLRKDYKIYKINNPEIKDFTLFLSGKNLSYERVEEILSKNKIKAANIDSTYKLSAYYDKIEELNNLMKIGYDLQLKENNSECFCVCRGFFDKFYEWFSCFKCYKQNLNEVKTKIKTLKDDLNAISTIKQTNDLYIITLNNKGDYNKLYSSFPHFYLTNKIKNICKNENEKNYIYVNEAPNPVDVKWRNLEFNKENEFWYNKWKIIYKYVLFILVSFTLNIIGELLANKISKRKLIMQYIVNIIFAIFQEILNDWFFDIKINFRKKFKLFIIFRCQLLFYIF